MFGVKFNVQGTMGAKPEPELKNSTQNSAPLTVLNLVISRHEIDYFNSVDSKTLSAFTLIKKLESFSHF